jgi:hypothetical protein
MAAKGKSLRVLPETELLKPISHLLHESAPAIGLCARIGEFSQ